MFELNHAVETFCEEAGLDKAHPDANGRYRIQIEETELQIFETRERGTILMTLLPDPRLVAEKREEDPADFLTGLIRLNAARVRKFGRQEVLAFDSEEETLMLWRPLEPHTSLREFLQMTESLLGETAFWKAHLAA